MGERERFNVKELVMKNAKITKRKRVKYTGTNGMAVVRSPARQGMVQADALI